MKRVQNVSKLVSKMWIASGESSEIRSVCVEYFSVLS